MSAKTPLIGGHRGFKRLFPENSILSFQKAIDNNATIIETDLHVTKDAQVLVSHDPSTLRVYGENHNILKSTWDQLNHLRTVEDPHEPLITLHKLLVWFDSKAKENNRLQIMLDIKISNPVSILSAIKKELLVVNSDLNYWNSKIIFGLWGLSFYKHIVSENLFPSFPIYNITISPRIAKSFIDFSNSLATDENDYKLSGVSLVHTASWAPNFNKDFKKKWIDGNDLKLFLWTVNDPKVMRWSNSLNCGGIITDSPDLAYEVFASSSIPSTYITTQQNESSSSESVPLLGKNGDKNQQELNFKFESVFTKAGLTERAKFALFNVYEVIVYNNLFTFGIGKYNVGNLLFYTNKILSPL